jgi:hypothetical protein
MPRTFAREIAKHYFGVGKERFRQEFREILELGHEGKPGGLKPEDFSLRDLAEEFVTSRDGREVVGRDWVKYSLDPSRSQDLQEAISAVDSSAFRDISGQLLIRATMTAYANPTFTLSAAIPTQPTPFTRGEKVPGMALPRDPEVDHLEALVVNELEEYKTIGFSAEYTELPATVKRGGIIAVSREMIFEDLTGLAIQRAQHIGRILGMRKELRLADLVLGYTNNYKEKRANLSSSTSRYTYYGIADSSAPWINHLDNNTLDDYTALDAAEQLFTDMTDPNTGMPIILEGRTLIHAPGMWSTVQRITRTTETRANTQSSAYTTIVPFPLVRPGLTTLESTFLWFQCKSRFSLSSSDATSYWWYGDLARAFAYLSNWDIELTQAAANSDAEFRQDIVYQIKASERGEAAVLEPRRMVRNRSSATSSSYGV